jgi:hypothetical protein
MSDTMSASGAQALEPRPGMSGLVSDKSGLAGTYTERPPCCLAWATVTIQSGTKIEDELRLEASDADGQSSFSGFSILNIDPLHPPVKFASRDNLKNEFVYASLCDGILTLTYIYHQEEGSQDSPITGVWLGTSSGGQVYRPVRV